jgi:hypothetical protein
MRSRRVTMSAPSALHGGGVIVVLGSDCPDLHADDGREDRDGQDCVYEYRCGHSRVLRVVARCSRSRGIAQSDALKSHMRKDLPDFVHLSVLKTGDR